MGSIPVGSTNTRPVAIGRACYFNEKSGSVQRRHGFRLPGKFADIRDYQNQLMYGCFVFVAASASFPAIQFKGQAFSRHKKPAVSGRLYLLMRFITNASRKG